MKYVCDVCGYTYDEELGDPDNGIAPGTKWEDLPEDFTCPLCGVGKDMFSKEQQKRVDGKKSPSIFYHLNEYMFILPWGFL